MKHGQSLLAVTLFAAGPSLHIFCMPHLLVQGNFPRVREPPSTTTLLLVMADAWSLARNTIAFATASIVAK